MPIVSVSGVRGVWGESLDEQFVMKMGRSFFHALDGDRIGIARDTRKSGTAISSVFMDTLLGEGARVHDMDVAPTPVVFREAFKGSLDGGIIITASHNPPEWNGVKLVGRGGRGLDPRVILESSSTPASNILRRGRVVDWRANRHYVSDILQKLGHSSCSDIKVCLDLAGGAACFVAPQMFTELGAKVLRINDTPGIFERSLDPTSDELVLLSSLLRRDRCNVGFAYDCDADRVVVIDSRGARLSPDATLAICIEEMVSREGALDVAVSVDTTQAVEKIVDSTGRKVRYCPVGEANVVETMVQNRCRVGGEGSSGGFILSNWAWCRDGLLASALIAKYVARVGSLTGILEKLSEYHQVRGKIPSDPKVAEKVVQQLRMRSRTGEIIDGVKVWPTRDSWVLVRRSGTEGVLRVSAEAKTRASAQGLFDEYVELIKRLMA